MNIDIEPLKNAIAEILALDGANEAKAKTIADVLRQVIAVALPTLNRKSYSPVLESDEDGNEERAGWEGIRFAGARKQRHTGRGDHSTRCWAVYGTGYFLVSGSTRCGHEDAAIIAVEWDGDATDFSGPGYCDRFTSQITKASLEDHLEYAPESAQEILDAIRKAVSEDKQAAQDRAAKIEQIIATLH